MKIIKKTKTKMKDIRITKKKDAIIMKKTKKGLKTTFNKNKTTIAKVKKKEER